MSAGGENPFESDRIHSCSVCGVCPLKHNKRRHRVHRKLESPAEKARQVRLRQDPSIANASVPDIGIAGAARNRVPATGPDLEFMTALLRAILGNRWSSSQIHRQK